MFSTMALLKQNDERFRSHLKSGKMAMPFYSWRGQEVIPAAMSAALNADDYFCTIYRGVHDCIARGVPLNELWAELAGKKTGTCKGKGGPMHITHPASGVMLTTGVVGSSMPIANGLAYASQILGDGRVTVATFGDGASNIGAFHEALNLASLWKLPVIFLCSNNKYAEHTKFENGTAVKSVATRAISYAMPGVQVDGNDPVAMYGVARAAVDLARGGGGPTLIEAMTFRFFGHNFGDTDAYMDPGEKAERMAEDPYPRYRQWLIDQGCADEVELAAVETSHGASIDAAQAFAFESPYPELEELRRDVYGEATA
jgi:acetoin:2,6-dichlorophenolindophenol oxidoreductase subunit alpha